MKIIFFDLGDTLVRRAPIDYELISGALQTLREIHSMKGNNNDLPYMGLVIDTHLPNESPISEDEQTKRKNMILTILKDTKSKEFFEPIESHMTLSSEVGFTKSENLKEFFIIAISKTDKKNEFKDILFVTEDEEHISMAKSLGINTIHFRNANGQEIGEDEINTLPQLIPKVKRFLGDI